MNVMVVDEETQVSFSTRGPDTLMAPQAHSHLQSSKT